MAHTVVLKSIREIDLNIFHFPQIAIYNKPEDYPDKSVARVFDGGQPTNVVMVADDPETLRADIRKYTNLVWFTRGKEDVPVLVGVYL